ncbi:hypothetical protein B296_00006018 [Ensete ventricosum]|uniref:Uncharacterized protein n=1 Tax=Ensete ventricosum TaxID=4639 RepID=A0A426YMC3_ENSVE|nr:hypothetical protein B296_00006018 [Ensete ventricosum]
MNTLGLARRRLVWSTCTVTLFYHMEGRTPMILFLLWLSESIALVERIAITPLEGLAAFSNCSNHPSMLYYLSKAEIREWELLYRLPLMPFGLMFTSTVLTKILRNHLTELYL